MVKKSEGHKKAAAITAAAILNQLITFLYHTPPDLFQGFN